MLNFELINLSVDAILLAFLATAVRMHMIKIDKLDEKIGSTLSRDETKDLIEEEIAMHIAVIQTEIKSINETLSQIIEIKVKR